MKPTIRGIDHIVLRVTDMAAMTRFTAMPSVVMWRRNSPTWASCNCAPATR